MHWCSLLLRFDLIVEAAQDADGFFGPDWQSPILFVELVM